MKRALFLGARIAFLAFFGVTSLYCLLAYVPFTYQQVVKGGLLNSLVVFAGAHRWLYWLAIGAMAATFLWDRGLRRFPRTMFGLLALGGIGLLFRPLLPNLENTDASYYWSLLMLMPVLGVAVLDSLGAASVQRIDRPLLDEHRAFAAAWQSALIVCLLYAEVAHHRGPAWNWTEGSVAVSWSIVHHLLIFGALYAALNWIAAAAYMFPRPERVQFVLLHVLGALALWFVLRTVVFQAITFDGPRAELYAALLGVSVSACIAGIRLSSDPHPRQVHWAIGAVAIVAVAVAGGWFAVQSSKLDWNYLVQKLTATGIWLAAFVVLYRMPLRVPIPRRSIPAMLLITAAVGIGFRTLQATPLRETQGGVLDRYAGYDASFRLIHDLLAPPAAVDEEAFYRFLSQNTNIPRSIAVAPVPVNLVEHLEADRGPKPNIFIFVIDSLRRDYLSPYNSAVKFTPRVADFARDSVVMENAFTRYGGTGLSEPSIWVGGMMLHKQYITPFEPMNSLEKLIQAHQYQALISRDTILSTIVGKWPALTELDQSSTTMFYDFCSTLRELDGKIGAAPKGPLFAYAQPQNIHISVIQREKESVLPGGPWGDFYAPYASRLARMDACFGGFVQSLKNRKMYDDSIIILTADHGDSLGEEGRWGHAYTIFPEILKIPLIVHLPPAMRKRMAWDPARIAFLTDVAPSLYYLLGNRPIRPNEMFGRPLFTETADEQKAYERSDYMVASSYAAVYGMLSANGRRLYVADAANHRDYAFDLSGTGSSVGVTDALRSAGQQRIRDNILKINEFYKFTAGGASVPAGGKD